MLRCLLGRGVLLQKNGQSILSSRMMCMWPERFEDPILDTKELNRIKGTTEYNRKAAVPVKSAPKDATFAYFQDPILLKFMKMVQLHSNGMKGEIIMLKLYDNIKSIQLKKKKGTVETDPSIIIKQAIENTRPYLFLEKVKVGGVQYRVPAPITDTRSYFEGMRWIHHTARDERGNPRWIGRKKNPDEPVRPSITIWDALSKEILDAYNNTGRAISKKAEYHRICEQNRAYAHYRRTK